MQELRLFFAPAVDTCFRAQLADAGGRRLGVEVPFTPFLTDDDYEDLRWYLEEYMDLPDGGAVVRAERVERNLGDWGRRIYDALFAVEDNRGYLSELLEGPEPRLLTIATQEPALLRLPWELIADQSGSLAERLSVRRQLEELVQLESATTRPTRLPLRILYIVSRPADSGFIDPRLTAKALLDALDPLGAKVRVDFCRPPTLMQMEEMLIDGRESGDPYDIVHFDGHGTFKPQAQMGGLCFEKPGSAPATEFVPASRFGDLLARYSIRMVILEACRSSTMGKTAVFGSIAPRLIQVGVGSVLAMSHAVHVEATRLLLASFYRELAHGATIGQSVAKARQTLRSDQARWIETGPDGRTVELRDWFLPQLYQSAGDEALVPAHAYDDAEAAPVRGFRSPATRDEPGSFPPAPRFGFRGRAHELHELERLIRTKRFIVLHAMGGMGKTALATEAAHWWTRSGLFRDGACFLSFDQFMSAERVVLVLGTYLAGPKFEQLPSDEQRRRTIELFHQRDVLLVWDNFESTLPQFNDGAVGYAGPYTDDERRRLADLYRALTTGPHRPGGGGRLLITCRPGATGFAGARRYELNGLARADSLWLLASILSRDGLTLADPRLSRDHLDPLLRDLADHPLSIELVGPHLRTLTPEEIRADFGSLLVKFQQEAPEGRNQSLLASLEFSRRHLSPAAREALPWLGLFRGGVFELLLLGVSELAPEVWNPIRNELEGIALLRTEYDSEFGGIPFLRFHPTLSAAAGSTFAQSQAIRKRFLGVYRVLMLELDKASQGSQSRAALDFLNREEANWRTAVQWAVADLEFSAAARLGETFSRYLQMLGRLRERDAWVQWLKDVLGNTLGQQGLTKEFAQYDREQAWLRFSQGDPQGAVDQLRAIIERLRHATEFDPAFELAATIGSLGRVLYSAGASEQAIPVLREAVGHWEALVENRGGMPREELLASTDFAKTVTGLGNLSTTMSDLANAFSNTGRHEEALVVIDQCLLISDRIGSLVGLATGNAQYAGILMDMGRYHEADTYYDLALAAARQAGDRDLEGSLLQHQGCLWLELNQLERASRLYKQALERFRTAGDKGSMMRTYNLLGVVEQKAGRLAEARAWYQKSGELASQLNDQPSLSAAAQNIGIVWQGESEASRERGDAPAARRYFEEARRSLQESLRIRKALGNKPDEASTWSQLALAYFRFGDLSAAERHAHEAREIRESLGLKEAWRDYYTLSEVAQARGDLAGAAEWAKKRDALLAEIKRRVG